MVYDPTTDVLWIGAKKRSPSRDHYTNEELAAVRIDHDPGNYGNIPSKQAVVIWTLLDMLEKERVWTT